MAYRYALNCGQYVLHQDDKPIGRPLDELALCLSREDGILHKHGAKEAVHAWAETMRSRYRRVGANDLAEDIVVVSGRFPLAEINRCIESITYSGTFYVRLMAGEMLPQPEREPELAEASASTPAALPRRFRS